MRSNVTCFNSNIPTTLNNPLARGAYDPNLSAPAYTSSPVDNVRDVIKSRDNIGYAIGNMLYKIWQNLPTLSLPTASAEDIKQILTSNDNVIQAVNHDVEVSLRSIQRNYALEDFEKNKIARMQAKGSLSLMNIVAWNYKTQLLMTFQFIKNYSDC